MALLLAGPASAGTPPAGRPLAKALNPDGTLKAGLRGSFDASGYAVGTDAATGQPTFRPAGTRTTLGAGDENWQGGFDLPGTNNPVLAVARAANGDLYMGGDFTTAGGVAASRVARWNGTSWSALGAGLNGDVLALAVDGSGNVYAGGQFTTAGGVAANYVARWNGTAWNALGTGMGPGTSTAVYALAVDGSGAVYAGGYFTTAGGVAANYVARWNGAAWSALGTGTNNTVLALAVDGSGTVYAGGFFNAAGGVAANRVARWNGTAWGTLGTGLNGGGVLVLAVPSTSTSRLYAGGGFMTVGDGSKATARFGIYTNAVPTGTAPANLSAQVAVYPNPATKAVFVELPAALSHQAATAELVDALGRVVRAYALPAGRAAHSLPLTDVAAGIYTLRLNTAAGRVGHKLVVE
jgi:hypothetical protein